MCQVSPITYHISHDTNRQTDIATYRLNWHWGIFSEKNKKRKKEKHTQVIPLTLFTYIAITIEPIMQFHNRVANISSNSRVKRSSLCDKPSLQINLVAIMAMGRVYEYMAERLTIWGQYTNIKYTVYSIQYTVYSIQYTVYSIQYTV